MKTARNTLLFLLTALMLPLLADDIVVMEVGGLPVIKSKIHYGDKQIEAHIVFDMGLSTPMLIHEKAVAGFGLSTEDAEGEKVDIEFAGGVRWKGVPMDVKGMQDLEILTAKYAKELKDVPVVAIVGLSAVESSVVELDLSKGLLRMRGMASDEARALEIDYEAKPYGVVLNGTGPSQAPIRTLLAMRNEDSALDSSFLDAARRTGATPNVLEVGGIKFSDHAAFRFRSLRGIASEPVGALIGASVLRNFTVTIWPNRGKIAFVLQKATTFPQAEQDYFFALADENPKGVAEFIGKIPRRRLMDEACLTLWEMRQEDPSSTTETFMSVLKIIGANYDSIRRSAILTQIADLLEDGDLPDKDELVTFALELAMQQSGGALDQTAVHDVHVRLGRNAFTKGELKQARRHLLSAAFGMPKNGECNFWLGEVYKAMGKPRRAWSRYFQAILDPQVEEEILKDSLARLDELNRDPEFREIFNMVVAEQYMAGRLEDLEFHAPSRYMLVKDKFPGHVKLVEFFTDASNPETGGMQLAFQALDEDFDGEIALIEYHLNDPMHSGIAARRLDYYEAARAPLAAFDGKTSMAWNSSEAEKLSENAAENYPDFRGACLREEPVADSGWTLDVRMTQAGPKVSGTFSVTGEGGTDKLRLHAILCERSVMALESNFVFFHHFVARKALTPPDGLDLKRALAHPVEFAVDAEKMREDLTKMLKEGPHAGERSKPTYVDANKLVVVLFVQHQDERRVLAAKSFSLPQKDEEL